MALEKWLIDGDIFDRRQGISRELNHAVQHHKGITMRQRVENPADIERGLGGDINLGPRRLNRFFTTFLPGGIFLKKYFGQLRVNRMPRTSRLPPLIFPNLINSSISS